MAQNTKIEWARHPVTGRGATWNPITGCTLVSEGCRNCYAARLTATRLKNHPSRKGLARINADGVAKFTGEVRLNEQWLDQPLHWRTPTGIFVCAHGDLFAEGVTDAWIDRVFAVMALAPQHVFMVLTKRPERMRAYLTTPARAWSIGKIAFDRTSFEIAWPFPNVWLGTSVEDQATADARIPHLLATPAAKRFISAEPLLGPVDLSPYLYIYTHTDDALIEAGSPTGPMDFHDPETTDPDEISTPRLDWVIAGGESGPHARPMHPDWVRTLRDQCAAAEVPYLFKQWGEWGPKGWVHYGSRFDSKHGAWNGNGAFVQSRADLTPTFNFAMGKLGKSNTGRTLDGQLHNAMPEAG